MSWDMFLQGLPKEVRAIEEIPGHFRRQPALPRQRIVGVQGGRTFHRLQQSAMVAHRL